MEKCLTIYHLYPDLMDVYADHGNVAVLEKRCAWRGIQTNVRTLSDGEMPDFTGADIVLLGAGDLFGQQRVAGCATQVATALKNYVEDGGVLLAIGEGYQLLGKSIETEDVCMEGFGILDMKIMKDVQRHIGHFAVETEIGGKTVTLVGFEQHTGKTNIHKHVPFGRVLHGTGNGDGFDGVAYKNTFGTYMHGPILPKNPELADVLISAALERKYGEATLSALEDSAAQKAREMLLGRLK